MSKVDLPAREGRVNKAPPPLLGFNNNVRHRGRTFHIQTEDSGVRTPRIVTHLFADGGRIVKTARTDYAEHVGREDMANVVRGMMKEQHKAMFAALRAGDLDALLERICGPLERLPEAPAPGPVKAKTPPARDVTPVDRAKRRRALSNPNLLKGMSSHAPAPNAGFDLDVASLERVPSPRTAPAEAAARAPTARTRKSKPPPREAPPAVAPQEADATRPARSIFGDSVSEKSLDEVILSYLAEDLDGSQD
jgi:hypothetical protein